MTGRSPFRSLVWGAIAVGAMAGLVVALLAYIVLGISGLVAAGRGEILLLFVLFLSLVVAGYVAGRLAPAPVVHGGLAALVSAFISGVISITSTDVPVAGLITLTVVAAALGSAGGVLARWQRESAE